MISLRLPKILKKLHTLLREEPSRRTRLPSIRLSLEHLEDRLAPALAHVAPITLGGEAGNVSLSNTGRLTFTPNVAGATHVLDRICSAFNVDSAGNLWLLESKGRLWELPAGHKAKIVGAGAWILRGSNTGSFSVSASGVVEEVKTNGILRRFANGAWEHSPLAVGVTAADVDAAGNIYGLIDGDLLEWAPGQTAATRLNNGSTGGGPGNVISFQVGSNTVAWNLGYDDTDSARIFVSYTSGTNASLVTDNNGSALMAVYDVAADGSVIVADPGASTNTGVTLLTIGQFNVDTSGTDLPVNGVSQAGSSFQLSPDGRAIAVLDSAGGNLSAYTIAANAVGPEQKLVTTGTAQSFGIANDLKVYEFTSTADLRFYDPFATTPVLTPSLVSSTVAQWQLGPNGQVAFLTQAGSFTVAAQTSANVAQIGFAPNGQLYYLTANGKLFRGVGQFPQQGTYRFAHIDSGTTAFAINNVSTLVDIRTFGDVWRLTGSPAHRLHGVRSASTLFDGWVKLFTGANIGTTIGSQQAGIATGTPLFVLPDGNFFFLVSQQIIQLTANRALILASNQTDIDWESTPSANAGVLSNIPAFNPLLGTGTFFSALIGIGITPFPLTLL